MLSMEQQSSRNSICTHVTISSHWLQKAGTTFATHEGLRRYMRLNSGTYSASEKFQHIISVQVCDKSRVISISDDIIAFGRHDSRTISLCMRCCIDFQILGSQSPLKDVSSTGFIYPLGLVFLAKGVLPDPKKVKAIHNARPPKSVSEVRSFLAIVTYCAKFIFSFSDVTKQLRFNGKTNMTKNFKKSRCCGQVTQSWLTLTNLSWPLMPHPMDYQLFSRSELQDKMIEEMLHKYYVSRSCRATIFLDWAESPCSCMGCWKATHLPIFGGHFTLYTESKPVELNAKVQTTDSYQMKEPLSSRVPIHIKDQNNPSNLLSQHPCPEISHAEEWSAEWYVNFIANHSTSKAMLLAEIKQATKNKTLQKLAELSQTKKMGRVERWFWHARHECCWIEAFQLRETRMKCMTINDTNDLILKGTHIDISSELHHEVHQGIVKTKPLLCEKIWFPGDQPGKGN